MKRVTRYFFEGLLLLAPLVASVYIVYAVFRKIDGLFDLPVPGAGFAMTVAFITVVGFMGSNFISRRLVGYVDGLFRRLPLIKIIYTSVRDLVGAFVGEKRSFRRPVLVAIAPGSNVRVMGFVTCESLEGIGLAESVAVYLPQSYNFAGNLIVVGRDQVTPVEADGGDIMKFIVSGGVSAGMRSGAI